MPKPLARFKTIALIVLDGTGIGALPDAPDFGDTGSDTLGHIDKALGLSLPNLERWGMGYLLKHAPGREEVKGAFGIMAERSAGKDTTTGHWELAGLVLDRAFPTYPHGFPAELVYRLEKAIGRKTLCNKPASGTEIIARLGDEHLKSGFPILYTSADSVLQLAAHENVIPVEELYRFCGIARGLLVPPHNVGRVIARPFTGTSGHYVRTERRHDFSLVPPGETMMDRLKAAGLASVGVGKIGDIFAGQGLTETYPVKGNAACQRELERLLAENSRTGLIFVNLVDFDMLYGHRNDGPGFKKALEEFDRFLGSLAAKAPPDVLFIITADHGCDPYFPGTDHTREYVPLLVGYQGGKECNLHVRSTFCDVAATIAENFHLSPPSAGCGFLREI